MCFLAQINQTRNSKRIQNLQNLHILIEENKIYSFYGKTESRTINILWQPSWVLQKATGDVEGLYLDQWNASQI